MHVDDLSAATFGTSVDLWLDVPAHDERGLRNNNVDREIGAGYWS